ncbi:BrnA antitoxin family protein [Siccibacter turicensis]|uniref:Toxin-antitoxin system, antitoxin component n=1 Tax=Siccibacter turicensis TaxID=357233 RepID=A0A2P8VES7_9ENTR|nr:BrnA antitoxin family protein [Siccibacter turicensis]MDY0973167.1 BrnA antitoxin family protein [Siccibacter turicensis]PSN06060.1 toxin-antitoxin system, antitoxin component [Siccibacter turicensis]
MSKKAQITTLLAMKEDDIDKSDIPELPDDAWNDAARGAFYRPRKLQKTVRLDADVVQWLEKDGPGYQTRLNNILREAMNRALKRR